MTAQIDTPVEATDSKSPSRATRYIAVAAVAALAGALITGFAFNAQIKSEAKKVDDAAAATVATATQRANDAIAANSADVIQREADVTAREEAATSKEEELADRETEVKEREDAVTATEEKIDASKIEPGTYLVPEELSPGRYRPIENVSGSCYIEQVKNNDIINNMLESSGRPVFTVANISGSTLVIDEDCGTVAKI